MSERYPNFNAEGFLHDREIEYRVHSSGDHEEIAFNCPACMERGEPSPDHKMKLWLNTDKGTFYCYRCQWTGSLIKLVQKVANCDFISAIRIVKGRKLSPFEHLDLKLHVESFEPDEVEDEIPELELPYGYEPIEGPHPYLEKRGIPWKYAAQNDWGVSVAGFTKNRLIVPTFMDGRLVFWQARATWESEDEDFKKVLNPKGVSARSVLYNYDVAKKYKEIVVVEGFMDAAKVGPDAVATNGKVIHPQQCEWLKETSAKSIILAWDADAWTDGRKHKGGKKPCSMEAATSLLRSYGFNVRCAKLPEGRDPGSFDFESPELRDIINKATVPSFYIETPVSI